jgi:hypothetical protein
MNMFKAGHEYNKLPGETIYWEASFGGQKKQKGEYWRFTKASRM